MKCWINTKQFEESKYIDTANPSISHHVRQFQFVSFFQQIVRYNYYEILEIYKCNVGVWAIFPYYKNNFCTLQYPIGTRLLFVAWFSILCLLASRFLFEVKLVWSYLFDNVKTSEFIDREIITHATTFLVHSVKSKNFQGLAVNLTVIFTFFPCFTGQNNQQIPTKLRTILAQFNLLD